MTDYVKMNQDILDEWKSKFPREKQEKFAEDGIMNKGDFDPSEDGRVWRNSGNENELWNEAPLRVLFLTKDENLYEDNIPVWDVRRETFHMNGVDHKQNIISNSFFYRNEANILYGLLHTNADNMVGFHEFSRVDALKFSDDVIFARINCKKEGGGGTIKEDDLQTAIKKYYDDLKDQILALDADIFICCGNQSGNNVILKTLWRIFKDEYNEKFEYIPLRTTDKTGSGINYLRSKNKLAIDAYHLAYSQNGGEELRYYEVVGAYYEFLKYLKKEKNIDFTKSHRN